MRKFVFLVTALIAHQAEARNILSLLSEPKTLIPNAAACTETNEDLATRCIKEMCKDSGAEVFPMTITEEKLESFLLGQDKKPSAKESKKHEALFEAKLKGLNKEIDKLLKKPLHELMNEFDKESIESAVSRYFFNECTSLYSPKLPVSERYKIICSDPLLDKHPVKKIIQQSYAKGLQENLEEALINGYYGHREVIALIPEKQKELKSTLDDLKSAKAKTHTDQSKRLLDFMNKNWDRYQSLDPTNQIRFVKGLSQLKFIKDGNNESTHCEAPECQSFWKELIIRDDVYKKLRETRAKLNSSEFRRTSLASMKVQSSLSKNHLTQKELSAYREKQDKIIGSLLEYQNKSMSPESYENYRSKMMSSARIDFDEDQLMGQDTRIRKKDNAWDTVSIVGLAYDHPDELYYYAGAELGSPVSLLTDRFQPTIFKSFFDENFDQVDVKYSLYSLKDKERGGQILAHELGHHFSSLHKAGEFSIGTTNTIDKAKACITGRYEKFEKLSGKDAGEHYLEEEFSDDFAFAINTPTDPKLFCPMFVDETEKDLLGILETADTHPPTMIRALNQLQASGAEIPASCQELILKNADKVEYKRCL